MVLSVLIGLLLSDEIEMDFNSDLQSVIKTRQTIHFIFRETFIRGFILL